MKKTLRLDSLKARTAMNAKISIFVICVQASLSFLLHNLHECTFNVTTLLLVYCLSA